MVRHLPRAARRAAGRRCALFAVASTGLLLGGVAVPRAVADDLSDKRADVERDIERQHRHLDESSAELREATSALLRARADLAAAKDHLARTRAELAAADAFDRLMQVRLESAVRRMERARQELAAGRTDVVHQEGRLRQIVVSAFEHGDPALMGLSMVFTTQDPALLAGNMNASSTVVDLESTVLDRLEASQVLLTVRESALEAAKADVAEQRREAAANLVRRQALERSAHEAAAEVSEMVAVRARARSRAIKAKNADLAALADLEAERDRIAELIRRRTAAQTGFAGSVDTGALSTPVDGYVTSPFGWRTHPIWGYRSLHDGIDFGASCGAAIRAAADGRVISSYYSSSYGNRLIVDHGVQRGVGVATISNHLSGYAVSVGQYVERGQVIGYVGSTGWSTGCHLHFTVLQNGSAVDPMGWL